MPCYDYGSGTSSPRDSYEYRQLKERADMLARIACKAMNALEEMGKEDFLLLKDQEVREWWAVHKEEDRKRAKAEAKKLRLAQVKRDAIAKLTPEELKVLGIKVK